MRNVGAIDGVIDVDHKGKIAIFNAGAECILGYTQSEAVGRPLEDILKIFDSSGAVEEILPPAGQFGQYQVIDKEGREINVRITNLTDSLHHLSPDGIVLILHEISDQEAAIDLRSKFLARITQEFRTPLAAIAASVEILLEELELLSTAEISALLNSIHMSVSGLQTLIDNLIESMNIEANHFRLRLQLTDLGALLTEAIQGLQPLFSRREQQLHLQIDRTIPRIAVDPTRITQVLVNLLSAASKYSPIGQPIDICLEQARDCFVRIGITDRGSSFTSMEQDEIFDHIDSQEDPQEPLFGIGLGISVIKAIVEGHGGQLGIESREGGGSIFWFKLPYNTTN